MVSLWKRDDINQSVTGIGENSTSLLTEIGNESHATVATDNVYKNSPPRTKAKRAQKHT